MNILQDIKTAVVVFFDTRMARRAEASSTAENAHRIPLIRSGYWAWTMESDLLYGERWQAVRDAFYSLDEKTQHSLTFTPENRGEWIERARLWQRHLRGVLPPAMYHEAMMKILAWYSRCVRMRQERPA